MESPPAPPHPPASSRPIWAGLVLALAALVYAGWIYQAGAPYAAGSDSSGYLNSARLLLRGQLTEAVRTVPGLQPPEWNYFYHQPLGYVVRPGQPVMVPSYPIGLPLHYALAAVVVGLEKTARVVNALNVLAAGLLLYALGRRLGLDRGWTLTGVALLWACPIWVFHALQPLSDCVATTWLLAALYGALQARDRWPWAAFAGAAFAVAVLVRPTNLLFALPLAVALGGNRRALGAFILAGLPAAGGLGWYNFHLYGSGLQSGYGADIWAAFGREFVAVNLRYFAAWIPRVLTWPVVALALLGLPWLFRRQPRIAWLLTLWVAVFVAFYTSYFCAGESWGYLRFLLPAFPAIIFAALLTAQRAAQVLPDAVRRLAPAVVAVAGLAGQLSLASELHVTDIRSGERNYWVTVHWLAAHVPSNAILLTMQLSGTVTFYNTQPLVRWDQISPADFARLRRAAARQHRPLYAPLFPFEKPLLQARLGGAWTAVGEAGNITIWRLDESGPDGPGPG